MNVSANQYDKKNHNLQAGEVRLNDYFLSLGRHNQMFSNITYFSYEIK